MTGVMKTYHKAYSRKDVEIVSDDVNYDGFFTVRSLAFRHRRFDGDWSEIVTRELVERGHAVAVLPYDPVRDEVILIEQLRVGPLGTEQNPWLLEIIAGMVGKGEEPEQVALREAEEEAGCSVSLLENVGTFFSSPGGCSEQFSLYVGCVDSSQRLDIGGLDCEHEDIRVIAVSLAEALSWLENGELDNPPIWMALMWLKAERSRLVERWKPCDG